MDQLFLAASKTVWEGLKGRLFSRYGPAWMESAASGNLPEHLPTESPDRPAPFSATFRAATAKISIPYPPFRPHPVIGRAVRSTPVKIGRENRQHLAAGLRTLKFNALEALLSPEGVFGCRLSP
ncbi:MAG: hypothetical protein QNI97_07630 [Desulfobacterales bacterium]|nr:hypothetical protein [Desulfobacterales bacterium]